jgi:hypothetical protein
MKFIPQWIEQWLRLRRLHIGAPADSRDVKPVGKPDAGDLHVQFDERDVETEPGSGQ